MTLALQLGLVVILAGQASSSTELPPQAASLYQEGSAKYRLGQFKQAVTKFRAALALANRPSLLFNIAQCYRQLGQRDEAIFYYKLYLSESERLAPNTPVPHGEEVKSRLRQLEAAETASRIVTKPVIAAKTAPTTCPAAKCPPRPSETRCAPFYKRWWFWTLVGVAVAGATATTVLALQPDATVAPTGSIPPGQIDLTR